MDRKLLKAIKITEEMIERRDYLRAVAGDHYADVTKNPRRIVQVIARQRKISLVKACMEICEQAFRDGHGAAIPPVIAATVDLCEEKTTGDQHEYRMGKTT
jgi:hypothetical protein